MKKILFICAFLITGLLSNAQTTATAAVNEKPDASLKAKRMTEKMAQKLVLTAEQKPKVLAINLTRAEAMEVVIKANNLATQEAEKKKVIAKWNKDLALVLTKEQNTKLIEMQNKQNKGTRAK
ncbi:MAG: hypothetical protein M3R27_13665 [Bacteroidota bacterium]|nr:hypothetical protein [Bacteroidota bacterium]